MMSGESILLLPWSECVYFFFECRVALKATLILGGCHLVEFFVSESGFHWRSALLTRRWFLLKSLAALSVDIFPRGNARGGKVVIFRSTHGGEQNLLVALRGEELRVTPHKRGASLPNLCDGCIVSFLRRAVLFF